MPDIRRIFGDSAEDLAAKYLATKGLKVIGKQFRTRMGEIDLVALAGDEVVFVEVKARHDGTFGYPEEAVTPGKLRKIAGAAQLFLRAKRWEERQFRIDVIAIEFAFDPPSLTHLENVS